METEVEDHRCKIAAFKAEDPRCSTLLRGVVIEIEDPRCKIAAIEIEDPRCKSLLMTG